MIPGIPTSIIPSLPSSSAHADDLGQSLQNTPVAVVVNTGGGLGGLLDAVSQLQGAQNEPIEQAIAAGGSPIGVSGVPSWVWLVGGGLLLLVLLRKRGGGAA